MSDVACVWTWHQEVMPCYERRHLRVNVTPGSDVMLPGNDVMLWATSPACERDTRKWCHVMSELHLLVNVTTGSDVMLPGSDVMLWATSPACERDTRKWCHVMSDFTCVWTWHQEVMSCYERRHLRVNVSPGSDVMLWATSPACERDNSHSWRSTTNKDFANWKRLNCWKKYCWVFIETMYSKWHTLFALLRITESPGFAKRLSGSDRRHSFGFGVNWLTYAFKCRRCWCFLTSLVSLSRTHNCNKSKIKLQLNKLLSSLARRCYDNK